MSRPDPPAGRRVFSPGECVTVLPGAYVVPATAGPVVIVQGRTAAMLVELVTNALHFEDLGFGTVHLDLTPKKVTLRVERVCQPVHLAEPPESP